MSIDILKLWFSKIVAVKHKICPHSRYLHILYVLLNDTEGRFFVGKSKIKENFLSFSVHRKRKKDLEEIWNFYHSL